MSKLIEEVANNIVLPEKFEVMRNWQLRIARRVIVHLIQELGKMPVLSDDIRCDFVDSVNELHPKLGLKLQNTIINLVNMVAQAEKQSVIDRLKEELK